jgi:hypothetical protein
MAKFLRLSNGIPKSFDESGAFSIYDTTLDVVSSTPGAGQILPLTAGTNITLPASQTYTGDELQIYVNGLRLDNLYDYNTPNSTQISFTFNLVAGDIIRFYIDRNF